MCSIRYLIYLWYYKTNCYVYFAKKISPLCNLFLCSVIYHVRKAGPVRKNLFLLHSIWTIAMPFLQRPLHLRFILRPWGNNRIALVRTELIHAYESGPVTYGRPTKDDKDWHNSITIDVHLVQSTNCRLARHSTVRL